MATDIYSQLLFNDGEGLTNGDLNDAQRFANALVSDSLLQFLVGGAAALESGVNPTSLLLDPEYNGQAVNANVDSRWAYALAPGAAFLRQGSANNKIAIAPGTLLQKIANSTGADPSLLSFSFTGAEEFTLVNGDAANVRADLLQMKLEYVAGGSESRDFEDAVTRAKSTQSLNKRRRVQCTLSVKQGTASSTTMCTMPTPDAGYVPVGAAIVGGGWTSAGNAPIFGVDTTQANNVVIYDMRMPLRVRGYRVDPSQFKLVTAWALSNNNSTVTSSNTTNLLYVPCPAGLGRVLGVSFQHLGGATPTPANTSLDLGQSSGILSSTFVSRNLLLFAGGFATDILTTRMQMERHTQQLGVHGGVGPEVQGPGGVATTYGIPLWTNGRRALFEKQRLANVVGSTTCDTAVLRIQSGVSGNVLGAVTWYVAEGL